MATKVAAPGGGNWTVGATWVGGVAPLASDDAQLTVTSGNVTIDSGAVARSLDCTGYVGVLTHTAGVTAGLGDATAGAGNIALKLVAGMTYTAPSTGGWNFNSSSATQQTIDFAGKNAPGVTINGTGGSFILASGLTISATQTFNLAVGTFNTGNFACSWGLFVISGASAKTLTLGSSAITITGSSSTAVNYSGSNCTFSANTAVMTFTGVNAGLSVAATTNWNGLSLVWTTAVTTARITGLATVNNATMTGPASKVAEFILTSNPTFTGTLTINGNSTINRVKFYNNTVGTTSTVTAAAVSFTNVDFQDITAAGAIPWTGTSMGNALGNSNITFDAPATQTRTGAGGNWSTAGNWTSRVPLPQDNVVVGAGASGTLTADMPRLGADVDFTGFAGTLSSPSVATSYGSVVLGAGMTLTGTFLWTLAGRSAHTITSNGRTFSQGLAITAPGGTYTVQDAFISSRDSSAAFNVGPGNLTVNNVNMTFTGANGAFSTVTGATSVINMGTGTWSFATTATVAIFSIATASTINASTSTITLTAASANARTFAGAGKTYGTLTYTVPGSTGSLTITGNNTFNTINFSDASNARSLLFTAGTTTTVTNFNVVGGPARLVTVDSSTAATHTLVKAGGGVVSSDYLSIMDSTATPGSTWYAGANSVNGGNNTGWIFTTPPLTQGNMFLMF